MAGISRQWQWLYLFCMLDVDLLWKRIVDGLADLDCSYSCKPSAEDVS